MSGGRESGRKRRSRGVGEVRDKGVRRGMGRSRGSEDRDGEVERE